MGPIFGLDENNCQPLPEWIPDCLAGSLVQLLSIKKFYMMFR